MSVQLDLVVCSLEPWDGVWRRNQFLLDGLLRDNPQLRVLFVEPATDPTHQLAHRRLPTRARGLRPVEGYERLWAYQQAKIAPRRVGSFVDDRLSAQVRRAARRLGFTDPVLWINDPGRAPLVTATGWPALYDITDDWARAARSERELAQIRGNEEVLMRECAAVVVCSKQLREDKGAVRGVELIPNAVDVERYAEPHPRTADLQPGPLAMYVGTLHEDRLDLVLCLRVADALLEVGARLVFVGPDALTPRNSAALRAHSGVELLGARPHEQVPAYLQHSDVLVVPHLVDEFTESLDPIKLYEYLAVGRPVVATPVAGFRDAPAPVRVCDDASFPAAVVELVRSPVATVAPPKLPTWTDRVRSFEQVLEAVQRR